MNWMRRHAELLKRRAAANAPYTGYGTQLDVRTITRCRADYVSMPLTSRTVFTRDEGMHTSGWWKNPDYERCLHLSLSFLDTESKESAPHDHKLAKEWCELFFGDWVRLIWAEHPFSDHGRQHDVWHYRVFVHSDWRTALLPRAEVYTREFTERGWQSWSDLHSQPQESAHT